MKIAILGMDYFNIIRFNILDFIWSIELILARSKDICILFIRMEVFIFVRSKYSLYFWFIRKRRISIASDVIGGVEKSKYIICSDDLQFGQGMENSELFGWFWYWLDEIVLLQNRQIIGIWRSYWLGNEVYGNFWLGWMGR